MLNLVRDQDEKLPEGMRFMLLLSEMYIVLRFTFPFCPNNQSFGLSMGLITWTIKMKN